MEIKQVDEQTSQLITFFERYGFPAGLSILLCLIIIYFTWTFLVKRIEKMAEVVSEQTLKKYQAEIDKDLYKFQTKHQKQIDAIHDVYQKLQTLSGLLHFVMNGEPFTQPMNADEQLNNLILCRHDFKSKYMQHRLIFGATIRLAVDEFIVAVDDFITGFKSGLLPVSLEPFDQEGQNNGLHIAGIWKSGELDGLIKSVDEITSSIEKEFRGIFGIGE